MCDISIGDKQNDQSSLRKDLVLFKNQKIRSSSTERLQNLTHRVNVRHIGQSNISKEDPMQLNEIFTPMAIKEVRSQIMKA